MNKTISEVLEFLNKKKKSSGLSSFKDWLYVLKCGEFYKIGVSNWVEKRVKQIQNGNPYKVEVIIKYHYENSYYLEKLFHQKFFRKNTGGEWFKLSKKEILEIKKILQAVDKSVSQYRKINAL